LERVEISRTRIAAQPQRLSNVTAADFED